jgi:hypothetical protein
MKMQLGGQQFQTADKLKCGVLDWLRSQDKTFHATGISTLTGKWKIKCVSVNREYLEKE